MSERAAPWGVKRRSWTASRTRRRVSSRTGPESFKPRDTVATDTRASRATSRIVAWRGPSRCRLRGDRVDTPSLDRRLSVNGYIPGSGLSRNRMPNAECGQNKTPERPPGSFNSAFRNPQSSQPRLPTPLRNKHRLHVPELKHRRALELRLLLDPLRAHEGAVA